MAKLVIVSGDLRGQEFVLSDDQTIGRLGENEIPVPEKTVSRRHARVHRARDGWVVEDAGSSSGIRGEDGPTDRIVLSDGERFSLGAVEFMFMSDGDDLVARTGEIDRPPVARPAKSSAGGASEGSGARTGEFTADAIALRGGKIKQASDKRLSFSENAGKKSSVLGGDLAQEPGLGRWLLIAFVVLFAGGLFWLTQTLVAGG